MEKIKSQSRVREVTSDGITSSITWFGTREEMQAMADTHFVGELAPEGRLRSYRVTQQNGDIWNCELRYEATNAGETSDAPSNEYGKKSAQLKGTMLSLPLETAKNYRTKWNHYLVAAPKITAIPPGYDTTQTTEIGERIAKQYRWIKSLGEMPAGWHVLRDPTKPGVEHREVATYSVTETARFRSARAAGRMVSKTLNKIGKPIEDFGNDTGNWKCDDASISWSGKYWKATLTWTLSGDAQGWDKEIFG